MRLKQLSVLLFLLLLGGAAHATDHDNIDAGRPLSFDDAASIAYRERALEIGAGPGFGRGGGSANLGLSAEYLYGFARNSHLIVGFDPVFGDRRADPRAASAVAVGVFRSLNRETRGTPAAALRADISLPVGGGIGSRGAGLRLRGILSRMVRQYSRLHLNADANLRLSPGSGERVFQPALILGLTRPLGYPTRFDRTGLAEIAVRAGEQNGGGAVVSAGVGLRQQVSVRSVLDIGLRSDVAVGRGTSRAALRLVTGYSTQF